MGRAVLLSSSLYISAKECRKEHINMDDKWDYLRGDVYLADLGPHFGSEQGGTRPVLLIQNNVGNHYGPTLIVAPITSRFWKKAKQPTHCLLDGVKFLRGPSAVLTEQIITIDKIRVKKFLGRLTDDQMKEVDCAIKISLAVCDDPPHYN